VKKKVLVIFGTRPEAIKMAPLIYQLKKRKSEFNTRICVSAQHRQMLDQVLNIFKLRPDHDMNIMSKNQSLFDITAKTLIKLKSILDKEKPHIILVQGDTTTTLAASLAAYYQKILIGHVEAGLRTHDKYHPFPEEKNRHVTTVLADYHFVPTKWARSNLIREGIPREKIWITGNTVVDALQIVVEKQNQASKQKYFEKYFSDNHNLTFEGKNQKIILVTGHRRESFGEGFKNICHAIREIAQKREDVLIVYPVHLNPNVQRPVKSILKGKANILLIEPLEYEPFIFLMNRSYLILTDSGGIQEEAPSLGKPVLVMRNATERPEGIRAGVVKLVGTDKKKIVSNTLKLMSNTVLYQKMSGVANPYGDGKAAERIVEVLERMPIIHNYSD
jgi:UDP-N-acetylglucosamine 2-epimerase (non-hydrolysing)